MLRVLFIVALLANTAWAQTASDGRILFFDPDANHQAIAGISATFTEFLKRANLGLVFQAVQSRASFDQLVKEKETKFVLIASDLLRAERRDLTPLLVAAKGGDAFYKKLLVQRGDGNANTTWNVATTLPAADANARAQFVERLRGLGVKTKDLVVVAVSKDVDALLALSLGQVNAAYATSASMDVVKRLNPTAASSFQTVAQSPPILRPVFCTSHASAAESERVVIAMRSMALDATGKATVRSMGFDDWLPYEQGMLKR